MTLRRYIPVKDESEDAGLRMVRFDDGAWMRAADVLAWRDSIRAAVVAEREAAAADTGNASGWVARTMKAREALDALLAGEGR